MINFNNLVPKNTLGFELGEVNKDALEYEIYKKLFKEVMDRYIFDNGHTKKFDVLDVFCSMSYVKDCINDNVNYTGLDDISNPVRNGAKVDPDIVSDINNLPFDDGLFDFIFAPGHKIAYGRNHNSIFELERVIKNNGCLIASLPVYWYHRGFNQMLFCYRSWRYLEAVEINYSFINEKNKLVETSKYFLIYKFRG